MGLRWIDTGDGLLNLHQVQAIEYDEKRLSFKMTDGEWRYWMSPELDGISDGYARLYWRVSCLLQVWPEGIGDVFALHQEVHGIVAGVNDRAA